MLAGVFTLGMVLCAAAGLALAQYASPPGPNPAAENLTQDLVAKNARYHRASPAEQVQLLNDLLTVAADRQQLLASLIEDNPGEVLRVALPAAIRGSLPPVVQAYIEQEVEIEGELEVQVEDRDDGHRYRYFLDAASERFSLHFAADPPTDLLTGSHVRVNGVEVDGALALSSGSTSVQTLAPAALPNTFGAQKTLVLLVNFQDNPVQPWTLNQVRNVVFTETNNFDLENSFQQTWLTGDVYGWFTIPMSYTICDSSTLATYAQQAATAAGVDLSAYTRYIYAFPNNACGYWGLGTIGGNPSQAWIDGALQVRVVSHEMGHNFGLYHSHAWDCGTATLGTNCSSIEYGDTLDTMGNTSNGHFNTFQKERLGWLNYGVSPPITTVQADGVYSLDPYESAGSNPKALKILKSTDPTTGNGTWYYVEYRQAIGFDSFLSTNKNVLSGVVIHTGSESTGNSSYLLDMAPTTTYWPGPALDVGQSFHDPDSQVTLTPMSAGSTGATVSVSFGPLACVPANPAVTLSPSQSQWVKPGTAVTYTVWVTNNNNAGCTASTFTLQTTLPSGWTAAFASPTLTLSSGEMASTTLTIGSPASAADGFYTIGVTATNSADTTYTASTSATYVIVSSLHVTVSTDKTSYTRNRTVSITAMVSSSGGSPAANASVMFTLTKANGAVVTGTATTGANGVAVFSYRLKKQDPTGSYQVTANASMNSTFFGNATASFTVQ
jgi:uncharacterized repeat protein (TIGR01451 family)